MIALGHSSSPSGILVASALVFAADYKLTVSQDRLNNAMNEPQNWLLMNGDYGSTRYSKLTQINRENVRNLRMVWALALGGMQDVGQNGPESEVNPLIDNGFMYTTDGWGTVYKIDATQPEPGQVRVDRRPRRQARRQRAAHAAASRSGKIAVLANLPDGRVIAINRDNGEIVWDKKIADEERIRRPGAVPHRAAGRRRQGASFRTAPATAAPAAGSPRST